jgi:DNA-binding response OmpR family regulator
MKYLSNELKKYKILYVEDEEDIRNNVHFCLRNIFTIFIASNGKEGVEIFLKNKIDLIITDINLPIKDGITMLKEIKLTSPNIPSIITSAYHLNMIDKIKEAKRIVYLKKPFDMRVLLNKILTTLEG